MTHMPLLQINDRHEFPFEIDLGEFLNEAADLMYHFVVLLAAKESTLSEVTTVLQKRHVK